MKSYNSEITDHKGDFDLDWGDNFVKSGKENTDTDEIINFLRANVLTELEMNWPKSLVPKSDIKILGLIIMLKIKYPR